MLKVYDVFQREAQSESISTGKKHRGFSGKVLLGYLVEKRLSLEPCGVHIWAS